MSKINLAILFWFYKEPEICKNRLQILRKNNPELKIYGLFGGDKTEEGKFRDVLTEYLDDFYVSPFEDEDWKWINGDLMILDWYARRGKQLRWDSIAIVQWDTLVFDSIRAVFANIKKDQIYLSGLRKLDSYSEKHWDWTSPQDPARKNYLSFLEYVNENYGYSKKPIPACLFIFVIFPRLFLEKYLNVENKNVGMLEYKIPVYADIFGIETYVKDMGVHWWGNVHKKPLNAEPTPIRKTYIEDELKKPGGWRIFHPYLKLWPTK